MTVDPEKSVTKVARVRLGKPTNENAGARKTIISRQNYNIFVDMP